MLLPENRCQSPISTASPNPVNVPTPRRQPNLATTGGPSRLGGHGQDRLVQPVPPGQRRQHGVVGLVDANCTPGLSKDCDRNHVPCVVHAVSA
jgi:hypothetical protein